MNSVPQKIVKLTIRLIHAVELPCLHKAPSTSIIVQSFVDDIKIYGT